MGKTAFTLKCSLQIFELRFFISFGKKKFPSLVSMVFYPRFLIGRALTLRSHPQPAHPLPLPRLFPFFFFLSSASFPDLLGWNIGEQISIPAKSSSLAIWAGPSPPLTGPSSLQASFIHPGGFSFFLECKGSSQHIKISVLFFFCPTPHFICFLRPLPSSIARSEPFHLPPSGRHWDLHGKCQFESWRQREREVNGDELPISQSGKSKSNSARITPR